MKPQEFKTLRKSCFKTAKEAAKYFNTPYETWKSWESGKRRVPGIAIKALSEYVVNKSLRDGIKYMREAMLGKLS